MMGRALLVLGWLATAGFIGCAVMGYLMDRQASSLSPHVLVGLVASLLFLFAHSWVMFYLIGTGKAIKNAVEEYGLEQELVERTKEFKSRSYPWLMLAMGVVIATFVMGGAFLASAAPGWIHELLFFLTLGIQVRTLIIEAKVLIANERLMQEINARV